jgi:hypothetical protein
MTIESIELWHKRARPNPSDADFSVQLGCHLEEIVEMLDTLVLDMPTGEMLGEHTLARSALNDMSQHLKKHVAIAGVFDREAFLDSLADQVVTAIGVGHCAGMKTSHAIERVNTSNWTKTVDGEFMRDAHGKIAKPASYVPPDLQGLF